MANKGWISIYRQIQDCWIWDDKPYARGQAWVDLLLLANHADKKISFDGKPITIVKGQYMTSVVKLSERWGWSRGKTIRFLDVLESEHMITRNVDNKRTLITLVNYSVYQDTHTTNSTTDSTTDEQLTGQLTGNRQDTNNNDNNVNNVNKSKEVVSLFNNICTSYPKVTKISAARDKAITARLKTYTMDDVKKVFENAEASDFLKGKNNRDWSANFDWLIKDSNFAKVLDGNYKNNDNNKKANKFHNFEQREYDFDALEQALTKR